MLTTHHEMALA